MKIEATTIEVLYLDLRWNHSGDSEHYGIDIVAGFMAIYVFYFFLIQRKLSFVVWRVCQSEYSGSAGTCSESRWLNPISLPRPQQ